MSSARRHESPLGWRRGASPIGMSPPLDYKFDHMLQKFESEQPNRSGVHSQTSTPVKYDFAKRANELRKSMDRGPFAGASPSKIELTPSSSRNGILQRSASNTNTPVRSSSPITSKGSFSGPSRSPVPEVKSSIIDIVNSTNGYRARNASPSRSPLKPSSVSFSSPFLNGGSKNLSPESTGIYSRSTGLNQSSSSPLLNERETGGNNTILSSTASLSSSHAAGSSPFSDQIEQFRKNLIYAHDTISVLQRDVRSLEQKVFDREESIATLERKNKSLTETLGATMDADKVKLLEMEKENQIVSDKSQELLKKHAKEMDDLKAEYNEYKKKHEKEKDEYQECKKKHENEISDMKAQIEKYKKSEEQEETLETLKKSKQTLEDTVRDKDHMIRSLRDEIWRLNEEVSDGSYVREQAKKAEERAAELEEQLRNARAKVDESSKTIADLRIENDTIASTKEREKSEQERLKKSKEKVAKLEAQLAKAENEKDETSDRVKVLEKQLSRVDKAVAEKDDEITKLEKELAEAQAREKKKDKELVKKNDELKSQRARFDEYSNECAVEQETIAALERAIEQLEQAQDERYNENKMLKEENDKLSKTVEDAQLCISTEVEHSAKLKQMLDELAEINHDLGEQLRSKEDSILAMNATEQNLATLLQSAHERNERLEAERDRKLEVSKNEGTRQLEEMESKLKEKEERLIALQNEFEALKILHHTSTTQLKALREELNSTNQDSQLKLKESSRLVEDKNLEFEELKANQEKMLAAMSSLESELEELRNERTSLRSKLAQSQGSEKGVDELEMKLKDMEKQLDQANEDARLAQAKTNELQELVSNLKAQLAKAHDDTRNTQAKLDDQQELVSHLKETIENSRVNSHAAWNRLKELEQLTNEDATKAEEKINEQEGLVAELRNQLSQANAKMENHQETVLQLKQALEDSRENSQEAWQRLKELDELNNTSENKFKSKIAAIEEHLKEKEEQLVDSKKVVAEAQKMIYRLMGTVKELRRKGVGIDQEFDILSVSE